MSTPALPIAALPRFVQELVRLVGYGAAMELVRHFGGQRIRFAKTEGSAAHQAIAEVIGSAAARLLGQALDGEEQYVPLCARAMKDLEKRQIVARYEALEREGHGARASCNLLAREFRRNYRSIEIIVNSPLPAAEPAAQQAALF